ncbi:putative membrane protein, partial [Vibrio parahaemolyticus V-223/04]
KRSSSPAC